MKRHIFALLILVAVAGIPSMLVHAKKAYSEQRPTIAPTIFMYHDVMNILPTTDEAHQRMSISPQRLEQQFKFLKEHNVNTMFVSEFARALSGSAHEKQNLVVLTFDDGMTDVYDVVLPLLKKYHLKITVFANPGFDGTNGRMTSAMLRELRASGLVEIGAHTMTHEHLTDLSDLEAREQILNSKFALERTIQAPVTSFAYPFGETNERITQIVRRSGFITAVAADDRYGKNYRNRLLLPRVMVGEQMSIETFTRLALVGN